ncbi:MAG TPA: hypothetical protein VGQ25_12900 [Gemmatimonadales bacterium]|jgi:hypothetical protein|nr:hypothetical protein [Gemmatimonadales bacterium]
MMFEHDDKRFDEWLQDAARDYHRPPETPRDAMWARIALERQRRGERRVIELRPWVRWTLAAAAVLALGIGIGRWTAHPETTDSAGGSDVVYQVAATQYLSRTEAFLTDFRADLRAGRTDARLAGQARDLLTTTRLMLDSPAADDPHRRALLEDLELVLVQISQLDAGRGGARDADLITQGMDQRNVLPKLRSAIPSGPMPVRTEGAL